MVEQLISLGAEHDVACEGNNTALHEAMKQKNVQIVKYLAHKGANLVIQNSFGEMPLKYADEQFLKQCGLINYKLVMINSQEQQQKSPPKRAQTIQFN